MAEGRSEPMFGGPRQAGSEIQTFNMEGSSSRTRNEVSLIVHFPMKGNTE